MQTYLNITAKYLIFLLPAFLISGPLLSDSTVVLIDIIFLNNTYLSPLRARARGLGGVLVVVLVAKLCGGSISRFKPQLKLRMTIGPLIHRPIHTDVCVLQRWRRRRRRGSDANITQSRARWWWWWWWCTRRQIDHDVMRGFLTRPLWVTKLRYICAWCNCERWCIPDELTYKM